MARRWRDCNLASPEPFEESDDEDLWRDKTLELLSKAHTIGGIADFTLETVVSNYSVRDLLFFFFFLKNQQRILIYFEYRISPWD
jgi:hypothetical protein